MNIRDIRKGAWTYEEDKLLKACINKYGEGRWHLVPQRAGINYETFLICKNVN